MKRPFVNIVLLATLILSVVLHYGCESPGIVTTGGSEVVATLVRDDATPVADIPVIAAIITSYEVSAVQRYDTAIVRSTVTGADGSFTLDSLPEAHYTLLAFYPGDSLVLPPVTFTPNPDFRVNLEVIVMKAPGAISGTVENSRLPEGAPVFCYIAGTSYLATVNPENGQFTISNIPPDTTYVVTIYAQDFISKQLDPVRVEPGVTFTYPSPITLEPDPNGTVPVPEDITVWYDTLAGTVHATWADVHTSDVHNYLVYTSQKTKGATVYAVDTVADTLFSKVIFTNPEDEFSRKVYLQIASLDDKDNSSQKSDIDSLTALPPSALGFSILFTPGENATSVDTIPIEIQFSGDIRNVTKIVWWKDVADSVVRTKTVPGLFTGKDTLLWVTGSEHRILGVTLHDNAGTTWSDSIDATSFRPMNIWTEIESLNEERRYAGACVVDSTIIVFGGAKEKSNMSGVYLAGLTSAEQYEPAEGSWKTIADMQYPRYNAAYVEFDGKIYVFGGTSGIPIEPLAEKTVEMYNPADNTWSVIDTMEYPLVGAAACRFNDDIIISGGKTGNASSVTILNTYSIFNPADISWTAGEDTMQTPRMTHKALSISTEAFSSVVLLGGVKFAENDVDQMDVLIPEFLFSTSFLSFDSHPLSNGCFNFGAEIANEKLVLFGGLKSSAPNEPLGTVDVYSLSTDTHQIGKAMPMRSEGMAVVSFDNCIYSIGGSTLTESRQKSGKAVYVYYP